MDIADEKGEISKRDLIVLTKESKFWKKYMEVKARPGAQISKVGWRVKNPRPMR